MGAVVDHLWQSTWFALAIGLFVQVARHDSARVRHSAWLIASAKFLVPFALLKALGTHFTLQVDDERALLPIVQQVAAPLTVTVSAGSWSSHVERVLLAIWMLGSCTFAAGWLVRWRMSRGLVKMSVPCDVKAPIPVRASSQLAVPGVVGIVAPVLLLPRGLTAVLTHEQLTAVIAHELWHVRRRDNLIAALHALVSIVFWFHPLVWWIGVRLAHEREHACDEGALQEGAEPATYAHALLTVCKRSVEDGLPCMANATGGDLGARIRSILSERRATRFCTARRASLMLLVSSCVALPVASGMTVIATSGLRVAAGTHSLRESTATTPALIVVRDDYVYARNVSLRRLISQAYDVPAADVLGAIRSFDRRRYDVDLRPPADTHVDQRELVRDLLKRELNLELIATGHRPW